MQKHIYGEKNGLWYELNGDYYLSCLSVSPKEKRPIGVRGQLHLRYNWEHRKVLYTELLMTGKLNSYLTGLNEQAEDLFSRLVEQMTAREGVTEQLKEQNQLLRVRRMNSIRDRAMEVVNGDLIYT